MTDSTSTPHTDAPVPPFAQETVTPPEPPARLQPRVRQRRILWLAAALGLLVVAGMVAWLVHVVSTERTLRAVTSSVTLPAAVPLAPTPPAPTPPAAMPPVAAVAPSTADTAAPVAAEPPRAAASGEPRKQPGGTREVRKAKAGKSRDSAKRPGRKAAREGGTFARCPALGKPGAVMCRWHICNGGAGKEAACRPYLERRP
jgi:hypothetical protein